MGKIEMQCLSCRGRLITVIEGEQVVFKCEHCGHFYTMDKDGMRPGGEAIVFEQAMQHTNIDNLDDLEALRLFELLGSYSNSIEMAERIRKKINEDELQRDMAKTLLIGLHYSMKKTKGGGTMFIESNAVNGRMSGNNEEKYYCEEMREELYQERMRRKRQIIAGVTDLKIELRKNGLRPMMCDVSLSD